MKDGLALRAALCVVLAGFAGIAGAVEVASPSGVVRVHPEGEGRAVVTVTSRLGWACRGDWVAPAQDGDAVRFPLDCSDAVKGKAMMSVADGRGALMFLRDDGANGSAAFAMD